MGGGDLRTPVGSTRDSPSTKRGSTESVAARAAPEAHRRDCAGKASSVVDRRHDGLPVVGGVLVAIAPASVAIAATFSLDTQDAAQDAARTFQTTSASALSAALGRGALPRLKILNLARTAIGDAGLVALAPALRRQLGAAAARSTANLDEAMKERVKTAPKSRKKRRGRLTMKEKKTKQ